MAKAKRVRWECPNGLHPGVLGSTRPLANSTVRFCLPCSEAAGVLVRRVAPALERKRAATSLAVREKREQQRELARRAKAEALLVPVIDRDGEEFILDAGELLKEAWRTEELRDRQRESWPWRSKFPPVPRLVIRRGGRDAGRPAMRVREGGVRQGSRPIRERDALSGHAKYSGERIVLTVRPGLGHEWLRAIIVHEAAHAACPVGVHHGDRWQGAYWRAVCELYGFPVSQIRIGVHTNWMLDELIAEAILNERPR